jgi:hypothetical protein
VTLRLGIFAGMPILNLFPSAVSNLAAFAYVAGAVIVIVAVLLFVLVLVGKTPTLRWGGFHFDARGSKDDPPETDSG